MASLRAIWRLPTSSLAPAASRLLRTQPVASRVPSPWGLYDVLGNVGEWTSDWYQSPIAVGGTDPLGPASGPLRVVRGGSFTNAARFVRAADRYAEPPTQRPINLGSRLVRSVVVP